MIGTARTALAGILTSAGLRVFAFTPERAAPPMAILVPSGDWVTAGDTFGTFRIGFDVTLIVQNEGIERVKHGISKWFLVWTRSGEMLAFR
jgi:hypothetical protein